MKMMRTRTRSEYEAVCCEGSTQTALFLTRRGRSRFHLSTRLRCHDFEKDFDYPRYLLIHTRPGRRSLFGAEFGTADRCSCCDGPHAHQKDTRSIPSSYPLSTSDNLCQNLEVAVEVGPPHVAQGMKVLGYYTVREDHRTGFHCCQTLCHNGNW